MKNSFKKYSLIYIALFQVLFLIAFYFAVSTRPKEGYVLSGDKLSGSITEYMTLGFGSYEVTLQYKASSDENGYQIYDSTYLDNAMSGDIFGNLDSTKTVQKVPFWLYHKTDSFYVAWHGDVTMECITIRKTNALLAEWIISLALFFLLIDYALWRFIKSAGKDPGEIRKNKIAAVILVTTFVVSLPLMINYLLDCRGDISFHLARIEGIYEGLAGGSFPVRMDGFMLHGQGYADPIFYPNLFLYIPALFRLAGMPVLRAYKLFLGIWNFLTCVIAFYSFRKIVKSNKAALVGMIIYVLSPYRILCLYGRGALGEALALTFFPLVAAGLWMILSPAKPKGEKAFAGFSFNGIIVLAFGLTGILQSHILSCEMAGIFMILALLLCAKRTFRIRSLVSLVLSAVFVILLNLWFLIPFLQSYGMDLYVFKNFDTYLYENSLSVYEIFGSQFDLYGQSSILTSDLRDEMGMSLGLALLFGMLIMAFGIRLIAAKRKEDTAKLITVSMILGVVSAWITTYFFPWKQVENIPVVGKLFCMVQFPWRYLGISTFCFTLMVVAYLQIREEGCAEGEKLLFGKEMKTVNIILIGLTVLTAYLNFQSLINQTEYFAPYSEVGVNKGRTMIQAEYMYSDTTIDGLRSVAKVPNTYERNGTNLTFKIDTPAVEDWELATPMAYYPYYVARDVNSGKTFYTAKGEYGTALIFVPAGYTGTIKFYVPEAKKWLLGDAVSLLTLMGILIWGIVSISKKKVNKDERKQQ